MARKLKVKIPKRVAGVKIPKSVRKGPVRDFLNSSAGQLILAEALIVLGSAVAARSDSDSRLARFSRHPLESLRNVGSATSRRADWAGEAMSRETGKLSMAFSEAIRAFRGVMDEAEDSDTSVTQDAGEVMSGDLQTEPERAKKKPSSSRPKTQSTPH